MKKIMVVDDDSDLRNLLEVYLNTGGYEVIQAESGEMALDVLSRRIDEVDVMILDNQMPGMSGFELFNRMKKTRGLRRIPVIMLTGYGGVQDAVNFMDCGGDYYLSKPLPFDRSIAVSLLKPVVNKVIHDRNERRSFYENKVRLEAAQKTNEILCNFLAKLGHELKTPLHGILSFASLAKKKLDGGRTNEAGQMIANLLASKDRLIRLIQNIEHVAQLETGMFEYKPKPGNILSLLHFMKQEYANTTAQKKVCLSFSGFEIPSFLFDLGAMQIALGHLLGNAIDLSQKGGKVEVNSKLKSGNIILTITDSGPGFSDGEELVVFNSFSENSRVATSAKGTGLGLTVARGIIELHGGKISAKNKSDNKGAVLTVTLPLKGNDDERCSM